MSIEMELRLMEVLLCAVIVGNVYFYKYIRNALQKINKLRGR